MQTFEMNSEEPMQENKFKNKFWTHLGCTVPHVHGWRGLVQRTGAELQLLQAQSCCSEASLPTIPAKWEHVLSANWQGELHKIAGNIVNSLLLLPQTVRSQAPAQHRPAEAVRGDVSILQFRESNNAALTHLLKTEHAS